MGKLITVGKLIDATEGAARLGITSRRLRVLCGQRRVPGARCIAGRWFVPADCKIIPPKGKTK